MAAGFLMQLLLYNKKEGCFMRKRMLSIWLCLMMVMSMLPTVSFAAESDTASEGEATTTALEGGATIYVDAVNGDDTQPGVGTTADKAYKTLATAVTKAASGDTIVLGEGKYTLYKKDAVTKGKDLTFVGQGADKTSWGIGATMPDPDKFGTEYNGDYSFDGAGTITFRDMTLQSASADYLGFIRADQTVVEDCIINGKTFYWGYTSATFTNTTFNCPDGDYAIWTYSSPTMTFDTCTFNSSGKVINVYTDAGAGKQDITVNFENCKVNNTAENKQVLNVNDSNMGNFKYVLNISGSNTVSGVPYDSVTCSRLYGFAGNAGHNTGRLDVNIDGTPVWASGKMLTHEYSAGQQDNAFTYSYGDWITNSDGTTKTRTVTKTCNYCGHKEETTETADIELDVSRSKTATALDTSTWTSNVTLSLPSAEEALASDVVFVLDKSTSTELKGPALKMLAALKEKAASTEAKVKVGVVIFNKQANKTAPLTDLATGYDTIEKAIEQELSSGTNTHAGLLAGKQMLDEDTEVAANRKYLIFVSDGISYMYDTDGKIVPYYWINDSAPFYSFDPYSWSFKYKNDNPPENWSTWVAQIGNTIAEETVTPILYADHSAAVANGTLNINDYKDVTGLAADQYTTCVDRALYYTYQTYAAAQEAGYNCYAVVNENKKTATYPWGPSFMRYLADGQTVDFGTIQNDILYAVSAGSTVEDQMGDAFDFVPGSLKLTVGGTELKSKADGNMTYFGNNAENLNEDNCRFKVLYAPDADGFVWTINENVSNFAPVQLTYTVKLTDPETDPGTYGVEDLNGEKNVPADKALFTNKRAVLNAKNSAGAQLTPLDFPKPSLSYTVKKSSSGGSSGGGGGRKPTVTIPDDVPTGLNGDDHFAYIVGYPDGNVKPGGNITRAEVATIFFRLLTEEVRTANSTQSNSLSDVTRGQWFNHAVSTLSSMGIVKGHNDGTFAPNAPITRAEFAAIAARFDDKNTNTSSKFTDIASHWAKNEIGIAANKGWINGYPDGTFRPNQYITRAEAMTLVNRVLNRLPENSSDLLDSMIKWPDNSDASAWYYLAVQEATNSHYYKTKENKFEKWTELRKTRDWTELEK